MEANQIDNHYEEVGDMSVVNSSSSWSGVVADDGVASQSEAAMSINVTHTADGKILIDAPIFMQLLKQQK